MVVGNLKANDKEVYVLFQVNFLMHHYICIFCYESL